MFSVHSHLIFPNEAFSLENISSEDTDKEKILFCLLLEARYRYFTGWIIQYLPVVCCLFFLCHVGSKSLWFEINIADPDSDPGIVLKPDAEFSNPNPVPYGYPYIVEPRSLISFS
jgi:hypothetical protein